MILKYNKFALKPTKCDKCGGYIWLERYRREVYWKNIFTGETAEITCKRCVKESEENT